MQGKKGIAYITLILLLSPLLTSCMVGPDFRRPKLPNVCRYTPCPTPCKTVSTPKAGQAGKSQYFVTCLDIPAQWWYVFHSCELNKLISAGLAHSPNLAAAKAALLQAQASYSAQVGTLFPSVTANYTADRERFSAAQFGGSGNSRASTVFNLFNANIAVAYTLDVFGGLRRQIEAACAQEQYQEYELEAAFLTLTSNIVTTAISIASLKAQIETTQDLINEQSATLRIINKQFRLGAVSKSDVYLQETQVYQTKASMPPLRKALAQQMHALSVLIGEYPCEDQLPKFDLDKFHLPACLPLSIPSRLVRQRPDIRAAEALVHVASAQIGVATANMYPQLTLTASGGYLSTVMSTLFQSDNKVWNVTAAIAQPLFRGGTLMYQRRAAIAAFQQAAAQYRQTVLQGFQNVADTLRALEQDARALQDNKNAELSARDSLILTRKQYRLGAVNYLNLLTAERNYQSTRINRIQAQAARYIDTAALFQALGGGWWNRASLNCDPVLTHSVKQYKPECFS